MSTAADHFWLWGHEPGSHNKDWGVPTPSRISPVEAAFYMGIPNLIMVRYGAQALPPDSQYAVPFRALRRTVWSVVGAGGTHQAGETDAVLDLPGTLPNMTGVMMDDFFRRSDDPAGVGTLPLETLRGMRDRLARHGRRIDLWVVLYDHQLGLPVGQHLALCDKVTFWTWRAPDLAHLEANFARFEEITPPGCGKVLGCYMWDYGQARPMPVDLMQKQCELALRWLREGRIEGMIFLASCICDLDLETVEWTRRWIAEKGADVVAG